MARRGVFVVYTTVHGTTVGGSFLEIDTSSIDTKLPLEIWQETCRNGDSTGTVLLVFAASTDSVFSLSCILPHKTVKLKLKKEILI